MKLLADILLSRIFSTLTRDLWTYAMIVWTTQFCLTLRYPYRAQFIHDAFSVEDVLTLTLFPTKFIRSVLNQVLHHTTSGAPRQYYWQLVLLLTPPMSRELFF